jgi:hypothetical protein
MLLVRCGSGGLARPPFRAADVRNADSRARSSADTTPCEKRWLRVEELPRFLTCMSWRFLVSRSHNSMESPALANNSGAGMGSQRCRGQTTSPETSKRRQTPAGRRIPLRPRTHKTLKRSNDARDCRVSAKTRHPRPTDPAEGMSVARMA